MCPQERLSWRDYAGTVCTERVLSFSAQVTFACTVTKLMGVKNTRKSRMGHQKISMDKDTKEKPERVEIVGIGQETMASLPERLVALVATI